jgi:xanthine dehydrogenase accessory factor
MDDIIFQLQDYQLNNTPFTLCIVTETSGSTPRKAGAKMLVFEDGSSKGTIGGGAVERKALEEAKQCLKTGKPAKIRYQLEKDLSMQCGGSVEIFFEPYLCKPNLFIFGAGHVGREVGFYAETLGFNVHFIDFRTELLANLNIKNVICHEGNFIDKIDSLNLTSDSYVVIATPSHESDKDLVLRLATRDLAYIGLIASQRKVAVIRKLAIEDRLLTEAQLARVNMPIGIPFKAETPQEIGISIVAKLIDVRNRNL